MKHKTAAQAIQEAQKELARLYEELGSWAAVAKALGLDPADRAAVHQVATRGSLQAKVMEALGLPSAFDLAPVCACGQVHAGTCSHGRLAARRAKVQGNLPVAGILEYRDLDGQLVSVDLACRRKRLGLPDGQIVVAASAIFDLVVAAPRPPLPGRAEGNG